MLEIGENKRSPDMENVNLQKEWEEKEYLLHLYYSPNFKLLMRIFSTLGYRHCFAQRELEYIGN